MQTKLQARPAMGLSRQLAISQIAKFGRKMQRGCIAVQRAATNGALMEAPVSLSKKLENMGFGGFLYFERIEFE
ncbi:hypothetical protein NHF39_11760 [Pseudomonas proteolytica]|nr:hypothetical protein NHF39_11760 [Pseudomonas proteolytica]